MHPLPGFRDIYPEDFAIRRYIFHTWRTSARLFAFREYEAPTLEPASLYEKKNSGSEILEQLYRFTDRGGREVALRPELTPSLTRMLISHAPSARKPIRWFNIGNFFRYERQQKGRLREFSQFNADIAGESSPTADAELIALAIHILRSLGFTPSDIVVRLSSRSAWLDFTNAQNIPQNLLPELLSIVDKIERDPPEVIQHRLIQLGISPEALYQFINSPPEDAFSTLLSELTAYGCSDFIQLDLRIVRGLAYYTGTVFEIFDRQRSYRAIAGGGRYDTLAHTLSDGSLHLPAVGLGMGDVVLSNLILQTPHTLQKFHDWLSNDLDVEIYLILAEPSLRPQAISLVSQLRSSGYRVEFPLTTTKVAKQFASAEAAGARFALLVGSEWPRVKLKILAQRKEIELDSQSLPQSLNQIIQNLKTT
ncbi:MAG: ATP phosphoribosyltransferase regulatory subunit [Chthoniobacterales bacterium]|nr:ATP phosphoribosyltransferase regulatory subunit [Chthoniobacterales bacterium]